MQGDPTALNWGQWVFYDRSANGDLECGCSPVYEGSVNSLTLDNYQSVSHDTRSSLYQNYHQCSVPKDVSMRLSDVSECTRPPSSLFLDENGGPCIKLQKQLVVQPKVTEDLLAASVESMLQVLFTCCLWMWFTSKNRFPLWSTCLIGYVFSFQKLLKLFLEEGCHVLWDWTMLILKLYVKRMCSLFICNVLTFNILRTINLKRLTSLMEYLVVGAWSLNPRTGFFRKGKIISCYRSFLNALSFSPSRIEFSFIWVNLRTSNWTHWYLSHKRSLKRMKWRGRINSIFIFSGY